MSVRYPANQLEIASINKNGSSFNKDNSLSVVANNGLGRVDISGIGNYLGNTANELVVSLNFRAKTVGKPLISFDNGSVAGDYLNANKTKNYITGTAGAMLTVSPQPTVAPAPTNPVPAPVAPAPEPTPAEPTEEEKSEEVKPEEEQKTEQESTTPTQGGGTNTPGTKSPVAQQADSADDTKVGGIKTQAIWLVGGFLGLIALGVGGFFVYKSGIVHRAIGWMLMHTGLRTKYRYYQVGAVAVYSANYLDPAAEAAWFEADEGYDEYDQVSDVEVAQPEIAEASVGEDQATLDTVYEPEPEAPDVVDVEATQPEMPVMEIEQPVQLISEDMPVPDSTLPSISSRTDHLRSLHVKVPKLHKTFSTFRRS